MSKEMVINVSEGEECRIALIEDGRLEELYMERNSSALHVGNIYKGKVTNVEPSIQAAFIDFGLGRNGFLHISDLMPTYFGRSGEDIKEAVGRKMARRDRPPIQRCLRRGDEIVVQIIKEGIGTKGPTLSTYLSVPGQILVMMPGMGKMGVSKKIEDEVERKRLRTILDGLKPPKDCGFIIRTSGIGRTKAEIERDLKYLTRLWETMKKKEAAGPGPTELYTEGDLITRTVRDIFSNEIDRIIVDSKDVAKRVKEVIKITSPRTKNKVELYEEPIPLFHKFNIEREIELMYSRHVPLPSGGSLVIDSTEAVVAIDVNSGKFRDHNDAEMTAFKTDMEAAEEIPRQLKLRDLGGVIICDFIDLRFERNRRELEHKLHENFKRDRAKTKVLRMSQFGIIELTRQRMRPSLKRSIYFDCPHCKGSGLVKTPESMCLDVMRRLAIAAHDERVLRVEVSVNSDVAFHLQNKKRSSIAQVEEETGKQILVRSDASLALDEIKWQLFDARDGMVVLESIGMSVPVPQHGNQQGRNQQNRNDRRDRPDNRRGRGQQQQRPQRQEPRDEEEDRFDVETSDESGEVRQRGGQSPESPDEPSDESSDRPRAQESDNELGEAPQGMDDRDDQRGGRNNRQQRGGRNRGGQRGQGGQGRGPQQNRPQPPRGRDQQNLPPMLENNGDQDVEVIDDEPSKVQDRAPQGRPQHKPTSGRPPRDNRGRPDNRRDNRPMNRPDIRPQRRVEPVVPVDPNLETRPENEDELPGPGNEAQPQNENEGDEGDNGPRRRRRRRGGRRHRRHDGSGPQNEGDSDRNEARNDRGNSESPEPDANESGDNSGENDDKSQEEPRQRQDKPRVPVAPHRQPPVHRPAPVARQSPPTPRPVIEQPPVVRTGSADKHLASDVPVDPQPIRRPGSYSDLDAIPDDFD